MTSLVNKTEKEENELFFNEDLVETGKKMVEKNEFFDDLTELMENPRFLNFYNKYLYSTTEIKTTMIYMKLYDNIKKKFKELTDQELNKYVNIYLLHHIMTTSRLRRIAIDTTLKHLENNKNPIFKDVDEYFEKYLKNNPRKIVKSLSL